MLGVTLASTNIHFANENNYLLQNGMLSNLFCKLTISSSENSVIPAAEISSNLQTLYEYFRAYLQAI
jgi:hypothetical protein